MRFPRQSLVIPDGDGTLSVPSASWRWPYGTDVVIPVAVKHQDGSVYSLAGAVSAVLAFKLRAGDTVAALQVQWTITNQMAGEAEFRVSRGMAPLIPASENGYVTGVQFRDDDLGIEDAILLAGRAVVDQQVASFDQPVTVPPAQSPLAQGPGFLDRGAYSALTTYAPRDVVSYTVAGVTSTYACILATTGNAPTNGTYWHPWATGIAPSDAAPLAVGVGSSAGTSALAARADHVHPMQAVIDLYLDPAGNDANTGLSPFSAFASPEACIAYAAAHTGHFQVHVAAGVYNINPNHIIWFLPQPFAAGSSILFIGPYTNVLGTFAAQAGSTATVINSPATAIRTTSTASIVAGAAAGSVRISGVTGYTSADIGSQVQVLGAASAGNNFDCLQISAVGTGTIDVINAQGVTADANNGAITVLDSFVGQFIECMAGSLVSQRKQIIANTATSYTVQAGVSGFSGAPVANTDTFAVEKCGATFKTSNGLEIFGSGAYIGMIGIKWQIGAGGNNLAFAFCRMFLDGCEIDCGGNSTFNLRTTTDVVSGNPATAAFNWGNEPNASNPFLVGGFTGTAKRNGCGTFIHNGSWNANAKSRANRYFVCRTVSMSIADSTEYNLTQFNFKRVTLSIDPHSRFLCTVTGNLWDQQLTPSATTGLLNASVGAYFSLANAILQNSGGFAVVADTGAIGKLTAVTGIGNVSGGLKVKPGAKVIVDTASTVAGMAIGTNDMIVGRRAARTWADFNANAPIGFELDVTGGGALVMTAASTASAVFAPIIHWTAQNTWAEIRAQIEACTTTPMVVLDDQAGAEAAFAIPPGTVFNMAKARWFAPCRGATITIGTGCDLSDGAGSFVALLDGVILRPAGAACPSGTGVYLLLRNGGTIVAPATGIVFAEVPDYSNYIEISHGGGLSTDGGLLVTYAAGAHATIYFYGGSDAWIDAGVLGGTGIVYLLADCNARNNINIGTNTLDPTCGNGANALHVGYTTVQAVGTLPGKVAFNPTLNTLDVATGDGTWRSAAIPRFTTAARTALTPGAANAGRVVFDTDLGALFMWTGAAWTQIAVAGAAPATEVSFHTADWAKNVGQTGAAGAAHTNAVAFKMSKAGTITGARWWHPAGMAANVTVKLWDDSGAQLAAVTVTPTAGAINTASFAAAYAMAPSNKMYFLSVYDGANKILFNASIGKPGGYTSSASVGGLWGPELWQFGHSFAVGDAAPLSLEDRVVGIEPLYTVT